MFVYDAQTRFLPERNVDKNERIRDVERFSRQAFAEFGAMALWGSRPVENPALDDALAITKGLRAEGDRAGGERTARGPGGDHAPASAGARRS